MKNESSFTDNSVFERLKLIKDCPLCTHAFEANKVVLLDKYKSNHLVHITCSYCNSYILHMVVGTSAGANAVGIMTDLSPDEVVGLKKLPQLDEDNLLEFHKMFQQANNQFTKLIFENYNN